MAKKLFISFLGTGFYEKATYNDDKKDYSPTRFIQCATLQQVGADSWEEGDAVRILVTRKAKETNWDKSLTSRRNPRTQQDEPYSGMEKELEDMGLKADVKAIDVPDGKDEAEMWTIFQTVYDEIGEGDELYIDLTHAFRYLPMLVLVLSGYAKFLKHATARHLSYGNWEARDSADRAPIVNLLPLAMLQDWTSAAADFLRFGYGESLKDAIRDELQPLLRNKDTRSENVTNVSQLASCIDSYVEERLFCRGLKIADGKASRQLRDQLDKIDNTGIATLNPIFRKLKAATVASSDIPARCYDAAVWCYERQQYQQAITLLLEGVNTFFCLRHNIDIENEDERDNIGKSFNILYYKKDGPYNAVIKSLLADDLINNTATINRYVDLGGIRNDLNHAGFRGKGKAKRIPLKTSSIKKGIKKNLDFFGDLMLNNDTTCIDKLDCTSPSNASSTSTAISKSDDGPHNRVFINLSNHPSSSWSEEQMQAARLYGEVEDMPFPVIPTDATAETIKEMAKDAVRKITDNHPDTSLTVHVMGEMTFVYSVVTQLKALTIRCVASCTEREVKDLGNGDRLTHFHFTQFREY